jgi:phosphoesterase RecJ-like protein
MALFFMKSLADIHPPQELFDRLSSHLRFLIFGHAEPDGDCLASQLALAEFLRRSGRQAEVFSAGPFDRPETAELRERFRPNVGPEDLRGDPLAVVLDCSTADRVGGLIDGLEGVPIVVIDHHAAGRSFGSLRWVVPEAPSTSFLVQILIESSTSKPTAGEAELLLFGLATDTGFFRHLEAGSAAVFTAVARLVEAGASPRAVYRRIYSGWELGKVRLLARSLEKARFELGGRVVITSQSRRDLEQSGAVSTRGSDEAYRILQCLRGVEVVAFVQEEEAGSCAVGLRSNGELDVGALAAELGGGGHRRAAGYSRRGTLEQVEADLLTELDRRLLKPQT